MRRVTWSRTLRRFRVRFFFPFPFLPLTDLTSLPSSFSTAEHRDPSSYYTSIPLAVMNDPRWARRYTQNDAPRLREIRKRLDGEPGRENVDIMAYDLLEEVVPLASDYIGNTIVQKVRFRSSLLSFPSLCSHSTETDGDDRRPLHSSSNNARRRLASRCSNALLLISRRLGSFTFPLLPSFSILTLPPSL